MLTSCHQPVRPARHHPSPWPSRTRIEGAGSCQRFAMICRGDGIQTCCWVIVGRTIVGLGAGTEEHGLHVAGAVLATQTAGEWVRRCPCCDRRCRGARLRHWFVLKPEFGSPDDGTGRSFNPPMAGRRLNVEHVQSSTVSLVGSNPVRFLFVRTYPRTHTLSRSVTRLCALSPPRRLPCCPYRLSPRSPTLSGARTS